MDEITLVDVVLWEAYSGKTMTRRYGECGAWYVAGAVSKYVGKIYWRFSGTTACMKKMNDGASEYGVASTLSTLGKNLDRAGRILLTVISIYIRASPNRQSQLKQKSY